MQKDEQPAPSKKPPIPWWGWVFACACFAIPIISLGGMIPARLGGGGGFACLAASRENGKLSTGVRIGICAATAGGCWILFVTFVLVAAFYFAKQ